MVTVNWDEISTRFLRNYVGSQAHKDVAYGSRPLLRLLKERDMKGQGGQMIAHRVKLGTAAVGGSYAKSDRMLIADKANDDQAEFDWSFYREPYVMFFQDKVKASGGPDAVVDLTKSKLDECIEVMMDQMLEHMCAATKSASTDMNTLLELVSATGAVGGIDPLDSGKSAWAATDDTTAVTFASTGVDQLRTLTNNCSQKQKHRTDAYLLTQTMYEDALGSGDDAVRINRDATTSGGTSNADLGLVNLAINEIVTLWDATWSAAAHQTAGDFKALALNFSGIHLVCDPRYEMKFTGNMQSALVDGLDADVDWARNVCQLTTSNRGIQGKLTKVA